MPAPQGLFSFPGVQQIIRGSLTFSHGIAPSTASVDIAPQSGLILTNGTLTLTYGTGFKLQFPGCRVFSPSIRYGEGGQVLSFGIQDRRWKWKYGSVFGRYNIKRADGTIDDVRSSEKTPQELAKILLDAMKEQGYDVSALPNKLRPTKIWDGNNPAQELAQLADDLGCRVVLSPITNRVKLVVLGTGKDLPFTATSRNPGYGLSINGEPDTIEAICGPTLFQTKLKLRAVGLDSDGRIKPIDKLSYKPSSGWGHPDGFFKITNLADRRLALRSVYRWYQITSQADSSMTPPGFPKSIPVTSISQYLPIRGQLLETHLDQQVDAQDTQRQHFLPAFVEGIFNNRDYSYGSSLNFRDIQKGATTDSKGNTNIGARYVGGFSIDEERGLVQFSDWVVKRSTGGGFEEAELYLTCSYSVTNEEHLPWRYSYSRKLAEKPQGTGAQIIPASDIQRFIIAKYDSDGKKVKSTDDNKTKVDKWAKELVDSAAAEYQTPETTECEYAEWRQIDLDGRVQQVQWEFSKRGAFTRASANTEFDLVVPPYRELREQQKIKAIQGKIYRDPVIVGAK